MSDYSTNEEREAMIAEARGRPLESHEADELALLADLLADPSTWAEPRAGLEDDIVQAVAVAKPERVRPRRTRRLAIAAAAAVAAIAIPVGVIASEGTSVAAFNATLRATPLAPTAHASAGVTRNAAGFRVRLDASGLPHLRAGEYYQAWLKNSAGVGVPIGTFSSSDGVVTLWSGVSPAKFPTISVTKELTDNNQASSGLVVLKGAMHAH